MSPLVSVDELSTLIAEEPRLRILDVRWRLADPDGRPEYRSGHIPGAVWVDLERELSRHGRPDEGRHPIPDTDTVQAAARRWGVNDGDVVVAYDADAGLPASRAWWLLRRGGVDVRVLDGGWPAWVASGGPVATDDVVPERGDATLADVATDGLSIDEAAAFPASGTLLDVRAAARFRGETEPIDPVAGHIPGAVNLPTGAHIDDGIRAEAASIRGRLAAAGVDADAPLAAYCGSGVTAARAALVLAEAGIDGVKLFHGSWSQWSNSPGREVATSRRASG